jgi:hypothetical protein
MDDRRPDLQLLLDMSKADPVFSMSSSSDHCSLSERPSQIWHSIDGWPEIFAGIAPERQNFGAHIVGDLPVGLMRKTSERRRLFPYPQPARRTKERLTRDRVRKRRQYAARK